MKTKSSLPIFFQLLILVIFFIFIPVYFANLRVGTIGCQMINGEVCPEILHAAIVDLNEKLLITTDFEEEISNKNLPAGFTLISVSKSIPATIDLLFQSENPLFKISCSDCQDQMIVGEHQHILSLANNSAAIPVFSIPKNQQELIENNLLKTDFYLPLKRLTESLYKNGVIFQNGDWISEDEIRVSIDGRPIAIFGLDNIENQSAALSLIFKRLN